MPRSLIPVVVLFYSLLVILSPLSAAEPDHKVDICVYGGTSGGVVAAVKAARLGKTAILIEPVQGEGGVRAVPEQCLRGLRELCDEHGLLLMYDEVQCGAGRTGRMWAHEWAETARPDIMAVAKGVGGGFPMGACLATEEVGKGMVVGTHGSTFGGNPLAMAVGNVVFDELNAPGFLDNVNKTANFMQQQLTGLADRHSGVVVEVRGKGLLMGLKLVDEIVAKDFAGKARDRGLLIGAAGDNVARMAPPLVIDESDASEAIGILDDTLGEVAK